MYYALHNIAEFQEKTAFLISRKQTRQGTVKIPSEKSDLNVDDAKQSDKISIFDKKTNYKIKNKISRIS